MTDKLTPERVAEIADYVTEFRKRTAWGDTLHTIFDHDTATTYVLKVSQLAALLASHASLVAELKARDPSEIVRVLRAWASDHLETFKSDAAKNKRERRDYETMSIALTMAAGELEKKFCK